jgi:CheY-like chemotaxis protein
MPDTVTSQDRRTCSGILLVDDDADIVKVVVQVLMDEGYTVSAARNGQEALDTLRATWDRPPCVILLDLMMPVMDGRAFRAEQLRDPVLAGIPVVVLTADGDALLKAEKLGVAGALTKPVDLEQLLSAVRPYVA